MTVRLNILLALACGLILANLYYTQPIIADIGKSIGLEKSASGLIVTLAQMGYCAGILLVVPLGDMLENKRLIMLLIFGSVAALAAAGLCNEKLSFFVAIFFVGLCTSAVQLIIPYGAALANDAERGKVIGIIASGAILGIVLARPAAGVLTDTFSWRACFFLPALTMAGLGLGLSRSLPVKKPISSGSDYFSVMASMGRMLLTIPVLRRQVLLMALVFSGFALFWATVPIVLQNELSFSHSDIAVFSLVSLLAPLCAVMAGRLADQGLGFRTTLVGVSMVSVAFLLTPILGTSVAVFVMSVMLLDCGVHITNVITQQSVISLNPTARSRLNALCISITFCGGAAGSSLGPWLYSRYGWEVTAGMGFGIMLAAFIVHIWGRYANDISRYSPAKS